MSVEGGRAGPPPRGCPYCCWPNASPGATNGAGGAITPCWNASPGAKCCGSAGWGGAYCIGSKSSSLNWYQLPVRREKTVCLYSGRSGLGSVFAMVTCSPLVNAIAPPMSMSLAICQICPLLTRVLPRPRCRTTVSSKRYAYVIGTDIEEVNKRRSQVLGSDPLTCLFR